MRNFLLSNGILYSAGAMRINVFGLRSIAGEEHRQWRENTFDACSFFAFIMNSLIPSTFFLLQVFWSYKI